MLSEFKKLTHHLLSWFVFLLILIIFFFSFGMREISLYGKELFVPLPTASSSFAAAFFEYLHTNLVPKGVTLIVTNPLTAFIAQIKTAFFLAFIVSFPFLLQSVITYFAPALYWHERRSFFIIFTSTVALFIGGVLFSYVIVIPPTFRILYEYTDSLGATPFFEAGEFLTLVFGLSFAVGIMFLLPIFMYLLYRLGIVPDNFWSKHWRYALFSFLLVSAIITPDGSGVSMLLLTTPLIALYGLGTIISNNRSSVNQSSVTSD